MKKHLSSASLSSKQPTFPANVPVGSWKTICNTLTEEQKNCLWQEHLHSDHIFYNRSNFFLAFETIFLTLVATLLSKSPPEKFVVFLGSFIGVITTMVWVYTQARQRYVRRRLQARVREALPEYQAILEDREQAQNWPFSSLTIYTYGLPTLIMFVWALLFIYALRI